MPPRGGLQRINRSQAGSSPCAEPRPSPAAQGTSSTNALRWALYSWGDDGERANVFFADFAKDGYQAKGYFGFVDECGDYSPWGHTWAVGTRAELDAAGWAEEAFPNEDVADY